MTGAKLDALKTAANDLVDVIMPDTPGSVKVGLVPFSQYVNIGLSRRDATWLDVPDDYTETQHNVCRNTYPDYTQSNCVTTTETCSSTRDGVTTTWSCERTRCDTDWGDPVEVCEDREIDHVWRGCAGSRNYPFNVKDEMYDARKALGLLDIWCAQELTPADDFKNHRQERYKFHVSAGQPDLYSRGFCMGLPVAVFTGTILRSYYLRTNGV